MSSSTTSTFAPIQPYLQPYRPVVTTAAPVFYPPTSMYVRPAVPTLYYWKIKARNYLPVVAARAGRVSINENFDTFGSWELKEPSTFKTLKENGTLPFGQYPYLVDGEVKIAQSLAIARYLAQKGGILGFGADFAKSEMLVQKFNDMYESFGDGQYSEGKAGYKKVIDEDIPKHLKQLDRLLRPDGRQFTSGATLLLGDYAIAVALDMVHGINPGSLAAFPRLAAFRTQAMALPAFDVVKDYPYYFTTSA